ncbi:MAG: AI-2E family transporter [Anaerovoracaceae bacterium]|nr:AI-2E family transporter [Anaerovoracaceae bacterium]
MDIKPDNKFKQNLLLVVIGVLLISALMNFSEVLGVLNLIIGLFMPLLVGGAIAFVINVPMSFFERQIDRLSQKTGASVMKKIKTPVCIIITFAIFVITLYFIGNVIFPNVMESIKSIATIVQKSYPGWIAALDEMGINTELMEKYFPEIDAAEIVETIKSSAYTIISTAGQAATSVFSVMANFVFGLIFAIYILASKKKLGRQAKQIAYAYLSKSRADNICEIASLTYRTFANFLSGQCLEAVILGMLFFVVLFIGNFPYAATIAVIIGSMALIPYVGAFIGLIVGCMLMAVISLKKMFWFIVVFFIVQQIEGQIIYPRVVGNSVGLPALWTLFAVVVGGNISGILGMLVFIPIFSVIYALLRRNVYNRLNKKKFSIEI